jgi:hypothetical protein
MPVIILIAFEVSGLFAVGPKDDLFTFMDFLATGMTCAGEFSDDLPGIAMVTCTHCFCLCPKDLFWLLARR